MATETWHDLGAVAGSCTVCDTPGGLTLGEVATRPSLTERLRREPVARPARLVTCGSCGWRWTVGRTSAPPPPAVRPDVPQPRGRHAAAALTVLPRPRDRRVLSARLR